MVEIVSKMNTNLEMVNQQAKMVPTLMKEWNSIRQELVQRPLTDDVFYQIQRLEDMKPILDHLATEVGVIKREMGR